MLLVFGKTGQVARALAEQAPQATYLSRAEADLRLYNPFASDRQVALSLELTSLALFTANRVGQCQRCLVEVRELAQIIQQLKPNSRRVSMSSDALERQALAKAEMLAWFDDFKALLTESSKGSLAERVDALFGLTPAAATAEVLGDAASVEALLLSSSAAAAASSSAAAALPARNLGAEAGAAVLRQAHSTHGI